MLAMDRPVRFVHSGDFHLERPPRGLPDVPDHVRSVLADAPYRAAERVFDAAVKHAVDFLVLAGDVVDPFLAGPRALAFLGEQFARLAGQGIKVYWAASGLDRFDRFLDSWKLPDSVVRFPLDRVERVVHHRAARPLVQILGKSTTRRTRILPADFEPDPSGLFSVAVAHGRIDAAALAVRRINYWALGGRHTRGTVARPAVAAHYPGTPQGRRPREAGPRGSTLVEVHEGSRVRTTFIPTDAVRYSRERVAVDESTTPEQLVRILNGRAGELLADPFGPEWIVRWQVVGSRSLAERLRAGKWAAELAARLRTDHANKRPGLWTVRVSAPAHGEVSAALRDEDTLLGEFLRAVRHYEEHPEERLAVERFLAERHASGPLGRLAGVDRPAVRRRVLAEAARLGTELLGPREGGA
jgi:DNA repair exonuclease SbcCD nuclease subunit